MDVANKDVLLLGVTYRGDVSDTRSSPVNLFYDECISIDAMFMRMIHMDF